jgi:hypothetical protein
MSTNDFENRYKDWHQKISFLKSGIRIAACLGCIITLLVYGVHDIVASSLLLLSIGLLLAEILGIFEEWI